MTSFPPSHTFSCGDDGFYWLEFKAFAARGSIRFSLTNDREATDFAREALTWFGEFEARISRFQPDSTISRVNAAAGRDWVRVDAEMDRMLDIADEFHYQTNGILDPSLLPLLRIWDWRSIHLTLPRETEIKAALELTGWQMVQRRPGAVRLPRNGMGLDFGYFTKEFAVDHLARLAVQHRVSNALIEFGRDLFALGGNGRRPFWRVGIEDGIKPGQCRGGLSVSDLAVSTSGDFARYFIHDGVRYGHIIDPRTGWPVNNGLRAVTVVAPSCLKAGMFSTAAHILGRDEAARVAKFARNLDIYSQSEAETGSPATSERGSTQTDNGIPDQGPPAIGPGRRLRELAWLSR